jgi:phage tail sheath protein FI
VYGDRTLLTYNTDTSFIGARRMYNYIEDTIVKQVLRKQEFKINDPTHRLKAKTMTTTFLEPIQAGGWIREFAVVCSSENNTDTILEQRQFLLEIYIKVTPTSEWCHLILNRISQNQILSQLIQGTTNA